MTYQLPVAATDTDQPPYSSEHCVRAVLPADIRRAAPGECPVLCPIIIVILCAFTIPLISACSQAYYFAADEKGLGTKGKVVSLQHLAAYYPGGIALRSPGYLIGLEDGKQPKVSHPGDLTLEHISGGGTWIERIENLLIERKLPFISQVYRYTGNMHGEGDCAIYNLYRSVATPTTPMCTDVVDNITEGRAEYNTAYRSSWTAIDLLKASLARDIETGNYSHLVVMMMGLDTPQEEAIRDFNSLIWSIRQSAGESFRPLIVGITWPSFFHSRWLDPVWEAVAYPEKADESDKLGISWVGVLMHEVIIPLSDQITTVAITHSFGARSLSMATCLGPAITRGPGARRPFADGSLHYLIGLAPAFSLQRFSPKRRLFYEDIYYPKGCHKADALVLTTTAHDAANKIPFWADLAGNHDYYESFCNNDSPFSITCVSADGNGDIKSEYDNHTKILYIDTTELMRYALPDTQGGAHSDIFRREVGHMIWHVLSN